MAHWQTILTYAALALALAFLVRKFLWPKGKKKGNVPGCGEDDCKCH